MNNNNFQFMTYSYMEQRQYITNAISLLKNNPFKQVLKDRLAALAPMYPSTAGFTEEPNLSNVFSFSNVSIAFSSNGGISNLIDNTNKRTWAKDSNRIGEYSYITLSSEDYDTWLKSYTPCGNIYTGGCDWVLYAHGKYNVSEANPQHIEFLPKVQNLYYKQNSDSVMEFLLYMTMDPQSYTDYGGAKTGWSHFTVSINPQRVISVQVTFTWWNKTSTRLPESHWFSFNPVVGDPALWLMDKIGSLISPLDIVTNGSHNLHGINPLTGILYQSTTDGKVQLQSLDIPLVSPGVPDALPSPFVDPDLTKGFHYLLTANIWGTNWPGWYPFQDQDQNSMFRFTATLSPN